MLPHQLEKAYPFEKQLEALQGPIHIPWTITAIATGGGRQTYIDAATGALQMSNGKTGDGEEPPENLRVSEVRIRMREKGKPRRRRDAITPEGVDVEVARQRGKEPLKQQALKEATQKQPAHEERHVEKEDEVLMAFYAQAEHRKVFEIEWELP